MSQENVEIVQQLYEAAARRDAEAVLALYDPSVEWDVSRTQAGLEPDVYRGHEGVRRFFRAWREAWDTDAYQYDELIDAGDAVVSIVRQQGRGRASGLDITRTLAGIWTVRDSKIVHVVWYLTRDEALKAVGLSK